MVSSCLQGGIQWFQEAFRRKCDPLQCSDNEVGLKFQPQFNVDSAIQHQRLDIVTIMQVQGSCFDLSGPSSLSPLSALPLNRRRMARNTVPPNPVPPARATRLNLLIISQQP